MPGIIRSRDEIVAEQKKALSWQLWQVQELVDDGIEAGFYKQVGPDQHIDYGGDTEREVPPGKLRLR